MKLQTRYKWVFKRLITVGILLIVSTAESMVYMWKDTAGICHYTNREYEIPNRYRAKAKGLYPEVGDTSVGIKPDNGSGQTNPVVRVPPAADPQLSQGGYHPENPRQAASTDKKMRQSASESRSRRNRERRVEEEE